MTAPWLTALTDDIADALPTGDDFRLRVAEAIPVGADLEPVRLKFLHWLLTDFLGRDWPTDVNAALDGMAGLFARAIAGDEPTEAEWDGAAWAAGDSWAAWAARYAGDARAARAAGAAGAACAARDARTARTARAAGAAGAKQQADKLVSLLQEAGQ